MSPEEQRGRFLDPGELIALGLPRDAARLAGFVQASWWSQGYTWTTHSRLAEQWGTPRQAVSRAFGQLIAAGVWQRVRVTGRRAVRFVPRHELVAAGVIHRAAADADRSEGNDPLPFRTEPMPFRNGSMPESNDPLPSGASPPEGNDPLPRMQRPVAQKATTRCTGNKGNKRKQQQSAREADEAALPAAAGSPGGGEEARVASDEPTGADAARSRGEHLAGVERMLALLGLTGSGGRDLAHQLLQHAADAGRDPLELVTTAGAEAREKSNPAGWMRSAIEQGWVASKLRPTVEPEGAHRQPNASSPVDAPPRVSPRTWDVDLERAVLFAISGEASQVPLGRAACARRGGVEAAIEQLRARIERAPADLVGTLLPQGLVRWRELAPDLEQLAERALANAVDAGEVVVRRAAGAEA